MSVMYPAVHQASHAVTAALIAEVARPGEWVLDVGAGDGDLASQLAAKGLRAVAADPRPPRGGVAASWEALPIRHASLAAATACASLQYADNPASALAAAVACVRPGGRVVVALSPVHASDEGARAGEQVARRRTGNPRYRHFSQGEVVRMFADAGVAARVLPFKVPGRVGIVRRAKQRVGVDLAAFPTFVGDVPGG